MRHVLQVEFWIKNPSGCHFQFVMDMEIGKGIEKGKGALIGILFMKKMENERKGR